MLTKIKTGVDVFELNPGHKAIPEFADLLPMQMETVALYSDCDSPLRTKPDRERRELAAKIGGYPMESDGKRLNKNARSFIAGETKSMEIAILKYKEIQYDETRAILEAYDRQIQEIITLMTMDKMEAADKDAKLAMDLAEKASKLSSKLPEIKEAKKKIQDLMNIKDNDPEINNFVQPSDLPTDTQGLSTLDMLMQEKSQR